jgi:hypothetical protein
MWKRLGKWLLRAVVRELVDEIRSEPARPPEAPVRTLPVNGTTMGRTDASSRTTAPSQGRGLR